jgi:two-component system NtrC family sensor kinase
MSARAAKTEEHRFQVGSPGEPAPTAWRYDTLRRNLLIVMLCITLAPLAVAASLGYFQYRGLIHREEIDHLRLHGERAVHTLEIYLDSLKHDVIVTANSYTAAELADRSRLDQIFARLKAEHGSLVDLSLIDPAGIQIAYAGPYALAGKDYGGSAWYHKTLARKVHLSEVFMGYRNTPHFVIAVSKKEPAGAGFWVVRASIDAESLDQFLGSVGSTMLDDIFLVSDEGLLQSSSRHYGRIASPFALASLPGQRGIEVTEAPRGAKTVLRAIGQVQNTPWVLVLEQNSPAESRLWTAFRTQLLAVSLLTALVAGLVIVNVAGSLANRIRHAEEAQESLIQESEHTSKLASVGRLAAGVAHEINNPLAIIAEKAGLMKDILGFSPDMPSREKFLSELTGLEDAVGRARIITHRLLGFSRRMDVHLQAVQVNDVIREVIGFLDKEAWYRGIRIEQELDPKLPPIVSDTGQLQQIFLNIINNAIDAVERGGWIQLTSQLVEATVQVDVRDNGPGIPPEALKKIFEPFFTTKTSGDRHGTGLGLSITYGLVKKLGGQISVHSQEGSGTVFRVGFPVGPRDATSGSGA